jgi:hypothetical protein
MSERHGRAQGLACAAAVLSTAFMVGPVEATLIWDGDPAKGTSVFGLFGMGNCAAPSTLTPANDPTRGQVWRYFKPASTNRCENHGVRLDNGTKYEFRNGSTYYLGWWSRISSTANNNANFQWKSYGDGHQQNFPVVFKMISGEMSLMQRQPNGNPTTFLWRRSIAANQWNHYVLGIHVNSGLRDGWLEFWFNGVKQTFTTGGQRFMCRTLDSGGHNCPKWGVYGGSGTAMTNLLDEAKVGTTLADVAMDGGPDPTPTATPTATPTPTPTSTPVGGLVEITPDASAITASTNDGNVPGNTVDGNLSTRWSANGDGQWIRYDLGAMRRVAQVRIGFYQGNTRRNRFDLQTSPDGMSWTNALTNVQSAGNTLQEEIFEFPDVDAQYVRYLGHGNTTNVWNSLTEFSIFTPVP